MELKATYQPRRTMRTFCVRGLVAGTVVPLARIRDLTESILEVHHSELTGCGQRTYYMDNTTRRTMRTTLREHK